MFSNPAGGARAGAVQTASLSRGLRPPLELALSSAAYWPRCSDHADEERYDGPKICNALLAALAAEGKPATPPWCNGGYLWRCCHSAAAVRWLVASGCAGGSRVPAAHAVALLRSSLDADNEALAAELVAAGADLVGDASSLSAQLVHAKRAIADLLRVCSGSHDARARHAAPVLASLAAAAAASHGAVIGEGVAAAAAAFAEAAEAREAELAASDAVIEAADAGWLARVAALDDFVQVATVALTDADAYARSVAWQALRKPRPDDPRLADAVLAVLDARHVAERAAAAAALFRASRAGRARNARALANAIAEALALPSYAVPVQHAPVQPQPEQAAADDANAHVTLVCADGGSVVAPPAAAATLSVLRGMFDADADCNAQLPRLPLVTAPQLALLLELLAAGKGTSSAAGIAAAAAMLEERCREPGAGEAAALPLLQLLLAADVVGAPHALSWAAAVAAARALVREGSA